MPAAHLVGIGRTDALARGADLGAALGRFVSRIENAVRRQDQVGFLRNAELFGQVVAAGCERLGLLAEEDGVNDNAVADDVGFSALKYARRNRAEYVFLAVELQRVTGIGTALKTGDDLVGRRQHIHDFSLALVTPLQAEDNVNFFHCIRLYFCVQKTFFASKGTNYYPKYPIRRGDFSTMYQKSGAKKHPATKKQSTVRNRRNKIRRLRSGTGGAGGRGRRSGRSGRSGRTRMSGETKRGQAGGQAEQTERSEQEDGTNGADKGIGGNQTKLTDGETKQTGQDEWADRRRDEPNRRKDETAKTGEAAG